MKIKIKVVLLALLGTSLMACSNHWREASSGMSEEELLSELADFTSSSSADGTFTELANNENAAIYFADAPGPLGPPESVLAMRDYTFLGLSEETRPEDLERVRIFFIDSFQGAPEDGQRRFALAIEVQLKGEENSQTKFFYSTDDWQFKKDQFVAHFEGNGASLEVYSYDLAPNVADELAAVIQLRISQTVDNADEFYDNGKINNLVGFGRN